MAGWGGLTGTRADVSLRNHKCVGEGQEAWLVAVRFMGLKELDDSLSDQLN